MSRESKRRVMRVAKKPKVVMTTLAEKEEKRRTRKAQTAARRINR